MTVRAKVHCTSVTDQEVIFSTVSEEAVPPTDPQFTPALPTSEIRLDLTTPLAREHFMAGHDYYADFSPVAEPATIGEASATNVAPTDPSPT
ncbi:MAG: hypothetical protein C5B54_04250 [Acidobacteria bacterium]|nr:MAG: hypothetical protein C5B54_04250 [Acidobacteriota bacterium]